MHMRLANFHKPHPNDAEMRIVPLHRQPHVSSRARHMFLRMPFFTCRPTKQSHIPRRPYSSAKSQYRYTHPAQADSVSPLPLSSHFFSAYAPSSNPYSIFFSHKNVQTFHPRTNTDTYSRTDIQPFNKQCRAVHIPLRQMQIARTSILKLSAHILQSALLQLHSSTFPSCSCVHPWKNAFPSLCACIIT